MTARRGRRALWTPGLITRQVQAEKDALAERYRKEQYSALKIMREYLSFCEINQISWDDDESFLLIVSSWRVSARVATSTDTNVRHLRGMICDYRRRGNQVFDLPSMSRTVTMQGLDAARYRRAHPPGVPIDVIEAALLAAPPSRLRTFFAFLVVTGLRGADFAELLTDCEVKILKEKIHVDINVAKNRRNSESKTLLTITKECGPLWRSKLIQLLRDDRAYLTSDCFSQSSYKKDC